MGIRRLIYNWLTKPVRKPNFGIATEQAAGTTLTAEYRLTIGRAINGSVITVSKFKRNPHGPDWTHQLYVVPEGTDLMDSIRTCLAIQAPTK